MNKAQISDANLEKILEHCKDIINYEDQNTAVAYAKGVNDTLNWLFKEFEPPYSYKHIGIK